MSSPHCPECDAILSWSCTSEIGSIGKATCRANRSSGSLYYAEDMCSFAGEVRRTSSQTVELLPSRARAKIPKRFNA
jgi:hypothetical protein